MHMRLMDRDALHVLLPAAVCVQGIGSAPSASPVLMLQAKLKLQVGMKREFYTTDSNSFVQALFHATSWWLEDDTKLEAAKSASQCSFLLEIQGPHVRWDSKDCLMHHIALAYCQRAPSAHA